MLNPGSFHLKEASFVHCREQLCNGLLARGMLRFPLTPFDQGESFSLSPLDPSLRHSLPAWGGLRRLPTPLYGNGPLHLFSYFACYGVDMFE